MAAGIVGSGMGLVMRLVIGAAIAVACAVSLNGAANAQVGPGGLVNPGRDCQTILQCRFRKGGVYRGCISAYSCRRCRLVASRNCGTGAGDGRGRVCQRLVCDWQ